MPTMGEAAQLLGIGRVTLEKWCKRLELKPTRHAYDYRYYVLSDEQVTAIQEARAQMPGAQNAPIASIWRSADQQAALPQVDVSFPISAPPKRPVARPAAASTLPDGMLGKERAAVLHGIPPSNVQRWCREGKLETLPGVYGGEHGHYPVRDPLTRRGLRQLWELAHLRADWRECDACPHADVAGDD